MLISIITITYNSEKTLVDTFNSILEQTYRPLQYIIVDGGSNDNTINLIRKYRPLFEKEGIDVKWISEKDNGISDAFNKGIRLSDGELIGIINSDDKLAINALDILDNSYESNIDVYYGNCVIFGEQSNNEYIARPKHYLNPQRLYKYMTFYHPAVFVKREAYDKFGLYSTSLKYCMDREILLRFVVSGAVFKYIDKVLAYYREGGTNQKNYNRTLKENMDISIQYGMNTYKAKVFSLYLMIHDIAWRVIKLSGLEKYFHDFL